MHPLKIIRLLMLLLVLVAAADLVFASDNLDLGDLDLDSEVLEPTPPPTSFKQKKEEHLVSIDEYCLCQCILKGQNPDKAKVFKGKKKAHSCLCECAK